MNTHKVNVRENRVNVKVMRGTDVVRDLTFKNTMTEIGDLCLTSYLHNRNSIRIIEGTPDGYGVLDSTPGYAAKRMSGMVRVSKSLNDITYKTTTVPDTITASSICVFRKLETLSPYVYRVTERWFWPPGTATGDIASVLRYYTNTSSYTTILMAGSRIKDEGGLPTTVTVGAADGLVVEYSMVIDFSIFLTPLRIFPLTVNGVATTVSLYLKPFFTKLNADGKTIEIFTNTSLTALGADGLTEMLLNGTTLIPAGHFRRLYTSYGTFAYNDTDRTYVRNRLYILPTVDLPAISTLHVDKYPITDPDAATDLGMQYGVRLEFDPPVNKPLGTSISIATTVYTQALIT